MSDSEYPWDDPTGFRPDVKTGVGDRLKRTAERLRMTNTATKEQAIKELIAENVAEINKWPEWARCFAPTLLRRIADEMDKANSIKKPDSGV